MMKRILISFFAICNCLILSAQHAFIYVSPHGNDKNAGTISGPLKSIGFALQKAALSKQKDISIQLRGGVYHLDSTISITPKTLNHHSLIITAHNAESVTLSGTKKIEPEWQLWKGNILKSFIGKDLSFDQLFYNGRILPMARYPDFDSTKPIYNGTAEDAINPKKVMSWNHPEGGYVHALHEGMWGGFDYRILSGDSAGNLALEGGWQNNRPAPMHAKYRFVENIFEELDAPGEWYYNRQEGILYLYPPENTNPAASKFEISTLNELIVFRGNEKEPVQKITIKNIVFIGTNRTFMLTREPLLRSDWTIYRGGALLLDGCKNIIITHCEFTGLGGNAIFVSNYNRNIVISENHIHSIGAGAIAFVGNPDAVRSPSFRYDQFIPLKDIDKTPGPKTNNYPAECIAVGNLIHNTGEIEKQTAGIEISMSKDIMVSHNTIYHVPRAGINIGDGCWGGHTLSFNDVFNTVLETGDHGAFNSWGRDRYWLPDIKKIDSIVLQIAELPLLDVIKTITIRNNRFSCMHGWDIDLDDGSSNYHIYNNICLNGGLKLREGFYRVAENNIILNNSFHPHVWLLNSGDIFRHNIVTDDYAPILMDHWGLQVDSNFFMQKTSLEEARKNGIDKNSVYGDPGFENSKTGNYHLRPDSKALLIGFKNFFEDSFGVQSAWLKKIADKPDIPEIAVLQQANKTERTLWMGATIKNIETLGEQSAAGLPDRLGVLVLNANGGTDAGKGGLLPGDVIRSIDSQKITDVNQMLRLLSSLNQRENIPVTIFRNQQEKQIELDLK